LLTSFGGSGSGPANRKLSSIRRGGLKGAIDKLLNFEQCQSPSRTTSTTSSTRNRIKISWAKPIKALRPQATQTWWYTRLLTTQRPLEQKLTVFWHNHFATSAAKVESGEAMYQHLETLRTNSMGSSRSALAVSRDPAMLYWLDNGDNLKGKPNENFAREVMELFHARHRQLHGKGCPRRGPCLHGMEIRGPATKRKVAAHERTSREITHYFVHAGIARRRVQDDPWQHGQISTERTSAGSSLVDLNAPNSSPTRYGSGLSTAIIAFCHRTLARSGMGLGWWSRT